MNTLLLNRFAIQCSLSKSNLGYEQIGLIPTLPSIWTNPYNLMGFQGGKLHLFYTDGGGSYINDTARYLMDGTREYQVNNLWQYDRGYQWSTDGEFFYTNNYNAYATIKINPVTYTPVKSISTGMRRECFCNPFDKKISVMDHNTQLNVWDLTTDVLTTYSVGSVPFANYMILRCEGGLNWWINSNIYCYDEVANTTYNAVLGTGFGKVSCNPYYNGLYGIISNDLGLYHYWLEDGIIHFESGLHTKLGLENLGSGFGTGKVWGCQVDPEDRNSLIFISITTGKIYRVKNLPKGSAN